MHHFYLITQGYCAWFEDYKKVVVVVELQGIYVSYWSILISTAQLFYAVPIYTRSQKVSRLFRPILRSGPRRL